MIIERYRNLFQIILWYNKTILVKLENWLIHVLGNAAQQNMLICYYELDFSTRTMVKNQGQNAMALPNFSTDKKFGSFKKLEKGYLWAESKLNVLNFNQFF